MTPTKLTHEDLCELWQRGFKVRQDLLGVQNLRWIFHAKEISIWIEEMEDRYGQDEE